MASVECVLALCSSSYLEVLERTARKCLPSWNILCKDVNICVKRSRVVSTFS
ncbi:hypothetical protein [Nostoc linckia]|uniref:hypothetical protein n=1 Tax=Nostoc linckia TaxID=92942 RepID=UPI001C5588DA|nr:hypothetical protein [Nostoc linckia]